MSPEERETIIRFDYVDRKVSVWSTQLGIRNRCKRAGYVMVSEAISAKGRVVGQEWEGPLETFRFLIRKVGSGPIKTGFALRKKAGA